MHKRPYHTVPSTQQQIDDVFLEAFDASLQDIERLQQRHGDDPCSSSSLRLDDGEQEHGEPPHTQQPQKKTSKFNKLKKRLRSKVKGGASKKKSSGSPFLEPSHRHSSVDMNGKKRPAIF